MATSPGPLSDGELQLLLRIESGSVSAAIMRMGPPQRGQTVTSSEKTADPLFDLDGSGEVQLPDFFRFAQVFGTTGD